MGNWFSRWFYPPGPLGHQESDSVFIRGELAVTTCCLSRRRTEPNARVPHFPALSSQVYQDFSWCYYEAVWKCKSCPITYVHTDWVGSTLRKHVERVHANARGNKGGQRQHHKRNKVINININNVGNY